MSVASARVHEVSKQALLKGSDRPIAEPLLDAPFRALGSRYVGEHMTNTLCPAPACPSVLRHPRPSGAIRCALVGIDAAQRQGRIPAWAWAKVGHFQTLY